MFHSMHTVTGKILYNKGNNNGKPNRFQFVNSHIGNQPRITDDCKTKFYPITNCFCKPGTETGYYISRTVNVQAFSFSNYRFNNN